MVGSLQLFPENVSNRINGFEYACVREREKERESEREREEIQNEPKRTGSFSQSTVRDFPCFNSWCGFAFPFQASSCWEFFLGGAPPAGSVQIPCLFRGLLVILAALAPGKLFRI
jgi:hypothetical protein